MTADERDAVSLARIAAARARQPPSGLWPDDAPTACPELTGIR